MAKERVRAKKGTTEAVNTKATATAPVINSNGLSASNILIPKVYEEVFYDNYRFFLLSSGRLSGKTSVLVALWWIYTNKYHDKDIVMLQATATEIKDSIINEIEKFLRNSGFDVGDNPSNEWFIPKSHDKITHRGTVGSTYFFPITDSKGGQRSRGVNTPNKVSLVLYEEVQKNKDRNVVEQSLITFIRQVDKMAKFVVVGNNETVGHWFVDFVEEKKKDPDWKYIYACCFDIWELLNEETRNYVLSSQKANPTEFKRVFLGDIHATTSDVVFPQFVRKTMYLRDYDLEQHYITTLIIGVDHATANDTFAIVPVAILDDGTTQTLEVCYDDPKESQRTLAPTEQCEILDNFINFLDNKYGIVYNRLETYISIDGAASSFIAQVRHTQQIAQNRRLWRQVRIKSFTYKHKYDVNLGIIKNAFAYGVLKILNEGTLAWDGKPNLHRLANEIERQRYKNGKLNPEIPNDLCDALEYGLIPYYSNCFNISFPIRNQDRKSSHYDDIRRFAQIIK